ncbi:shikimate dehydrogenase family protein [Pseudacidovorax sp. NFM-22]|uniref:shikimate dehydrogenase family protein n=1 Tax=Pseudacidovorax sp. NFM-22 TaxID=2744469 RepID=UPI001F1F5383|nr:shikimate dehydrogenase [Pseudacidovorax sp. NFM-22]
MSAALRITGRTGILFILADPVAHVVGSDRLNARFAAEGLDMAVSPLHVQPKDLATVIGTLRLLQNVQGFGVTIPHKIAVMPLLDAVTPRARLIGAVNFVRRDPDGRLTGDNLDGQGFVDGLAASGIGLAGRRVLQLGAGGAGRAVAFAVAEAGASALVIHNRTAARAQALAEAVGAAWPGCAAASGPDDPRGFDVVINTTSMGMHEGDPLPMDVGRLAASTDVAEIIMTPALTPLLVAAQARGCRISLGTSMLDAQYGLVKQLLGIPS